MQDQEHIPTVGEPTEFEYRIVRTGNRTYTIKRPIISDNDDYPKKKRMSHKRGPGRPKKKTAEELAQEQNDMLNPELEILTDDDE